MKRVLSVMIAVCMLFTTTSSIYATTNSSNPETKLFPDMEEEIFISNIVASIAGETGFVVDDVDKIVLNNEKGVSCAYGFTVTVPVISSVKKELTQNWIVKEKGDSYEYIVTDGTKMDTIYVDSNKNIYLDGNPVMIEYCEEDLATTLEAGADVNSIQMNLTENSSQTRGLYLVTSSPKKGNASDYTAGKKITEPTIALSKQISNMLETTIIALVLDFVSPANFAWKKITPSLIVTVIGLLLDKGYGSSKKLYLKETKWRHKNSTSVGYYSGMTIWKVKHSFLTPGDAVLRSETWYHNWQ